MRLEACMRAFGAARAAQLRVAGRREKRDDALHFDVRAPFRQRSREVNFASRIANLCGQLGEGLLLSEPFQGRLFEHDLRRLGTFPLRGVDEPQAIFAPVEP